MTNRHSPERHYLEFAAWPARDQLAWTKLTEPGATILDDRGAFADSRPRTDALRRQNYSHWPNHVTAGCVTASHWTEPALDACSRPTWPRGRRSAGERPLAYRTVAWRTHGRILRCFTRPTGRARGGCNSSIRLTRSPLAPGPMPSPSLFRNALHLLTHPQHIARCAFNDAEGTCWGRRDRTGGGIGHGDRFCRKFPGRACDRHGYDGLYPANE
jgi:hypothetical protein